MNIKQTLCIVSYQSLTYMQYNLIYYFFQEIIFHSFLVLGGGYNCRGSSSAPPTHLLTWVY